MGAEVADDGGWPGGSGAGGDGGGGLFEAGLVAAVEGDVDAFAGEGGGAGEAQAAGGGEDQGGFAGDAEVHQLVAGLGRRSSFGAMRKRRAQRP